MASTEMFYCRTSLATWAAFPAHTCCRHSMLQCLFIVRRGVNRVASRGLAPDGVIQLADDASSGVRLAVVCIVSVSVVVQYPLVAD